MSYNDFIKKMKDMIANQKKRKRKKNNQNKIPKKGHKILLFENLDKTNQNKIQNNQKVTLIDPVKKLENLNVESKDKVFIESSILSETKLSQIVNFN